MVQPRGLKRVRSYRFSAPGGRIVLPAKYKKEEKKIKQIAQEKERRDSAHAFTR